MSRFHFHQRCSRWQRQCFESSKLEPAQLQHRTLPKCRTCWPAMAAGVPGLSVSVDGDTAVVGARQDGIVVHSGSAYVFTRIGSTWTQQAELLPSDGAAIYTFGWEVSVDGDTAVVGAPSDKDDNGVNRGSAYVFTRIGSTWTQQAKLLPSYSAESLWFGWTRRSTETRSSSGPAGRRQRSRQRGGVRVHAHRATWTQQAKLLASDGAASTGSATRWRLTETPPSSGLLGTTTTGPQRVGVRVHAQQRDVDPAGEASGQRRRRCRSVWPLGVGRRRHGGRRGRMRPAGSRQGLGVRVHAQRHDVDRAGESGCQRRGCHSNQAFGGSVSVDGDTASSGRCWGRRLGVRVHAQRLDVVRTI